MHRKRFVLFTALICALIVGIVGIYRLPLPESAANQEASKQTTAEKALTILNDAVGLNTTRYNVKVDSNTEGLYYDTLPQESVKHVFEAQESKLDVISNFVEGKLRSMSTYLLDGEPFLTHSTIDPFEAAKDFLSKYQTLSGASHLEPLAAMLKDVEANQNLTITFENAKLEVTSTPSEVSLRWTYMVGDVEAQMKCVALKVENGFLKYFTDTWSLYKIGSTDLAVSEEEAIEIAKERASSFSWNVSMGGDKPPVRVTEFKIVGINETTLTFGNYPSKNQSRNDDPLTLYPGWRIKLTFDKLYPGNVYGVNVGVWADTGEVHDIRTMIRGL